MNIDLDALVEEDEPGEPFGFTFDDYDYELPPEMDIRAVAAIASGRLDDGLRMLLGPDQWQRLQDSPKVLSSKTLTRLFEAYAAHTNGVSVGESSASTGSAKNTGRPSKRTSNASTRRASLKSAPNT